MSDKKGVVRSMKEKNQGKQDILRMLSSSSWMIISNSPSETPSAREVSLDPHLDSIELPR